jgi:hypothetical protein
MACLTCGHALMTLDVWDWCPRCGTVQTITGLDPMRPCLVERCRKFEEEHNGTASFDAEVHEALRRLGIAESINLPENRPQ